MSAPPPPVLPEMPGNACAGISPPALAGMLLAARTALMRLDLPCPRAADILAATGVPATQAYARRSAILGSLHALERPRGRPRRATECGRHEAITRRVLRYLMDHPGAVSGSAERRCYSEGFKHFVITLRREHAGLGLSAFARAVQVSPTVLDGWLAAPRPGPAVPCDLPGALSTGGHAARLVRAWQRWNGTFSSFCQHVRRELELPWKPNVVARILARHGQRVPLPSPGRRVDAHAPRGAFHTAFPGAQWVTDGTAVDVQVDGERYRFNVQLMVDTASAANLGISVRDREDSTAVLEAFHHAVDTAGAPPLALLLDHRSCNHSAEVARLGHALELMFAAPGRPQSKAHVEGAFGLFSRVMPALCFDTREPRVLARRIIEVLVECWARTLNHRPRRDRGGRSRVQLYREGRPPQPAQDAARMHLRARGARCRRGRRARPRRAAALGSFVGDALARLGVADPDGSLCTALLGHPCDSVLAGLATYEGKLAAGTLPEDADGRYLLGVVRRIAEADEGMYIADALWRTRVEARAHALSALAERERAITAANQDIGARVACLIDEALAAEDAVAQQAWLAAAGRAMRAAPARMAMLYRCAARRIHAARHLPYRHRLAYVRWLAIEVLPVPSARADASELMRLSGCV